MKKNILITGVSGFLGSSLANKLIFDDLLGLFVKIENDFDSKGPAFDIINAGSENVYSVYDIVKALEKVSGCNQSYKKGGPVGFWGKYEELFDRKLPLPLEAVKAVINKIAIADIYKAKLKFGWTPIGTIEAGMGDCYEYAIKKLVHEGAC